MALTGIGALVEGINNGIQMAWQSGQAAEQRRENRYLLTLQQNWAEKQADIAYNRQLGMYNQYLSPAAQKAQLLEAGLSPALMYAQGGAGGKMAAAPQADTPSALGSGLPTLGLNSLTAGMANMANTELMKSQARLNNANANNIEQKTPLELKQMNESIENLIEQRNLIIAQTEEASAKAKNQEAMTEYNKTLKELANIDLSTRETLNQLSIRELQEKINNLMLAGEKAGMENQIMEQTLETQIRIYAEQLNKYIAENNLLGKQTDYYEQLARQLEHDNDVQKGIDDMFDAIMDSMNDDSNNAENRGKLQTVLKALRPLMQAAIMFLKSQARTKK